jgi:starch synthase
VQKLPRYKRSAKLILQKKFGLTQDVDSVLISMVGRLNEQKGIQLLTKKMISGKSPVEAILEKNKKVQFLVAGPLAKTEVETLQFEELWRGLQKKYPGRIHGEFSFLAHKEALQITQASDLFLMPSRYEPGGITQLESLVAGTIVVGHNIGGIAATLQNYNPEKEQGNSFLFNRFTADAFYLALNNAIELISYKPKRFAMIARAALAKNDWSHRAPKYLALLQSAMGVFESKNSYRHLDGRKHMLESCKP